MAKLGRRSSSSRRGPGRSAKASTYMSTSSALDSALKHARLARKVEEYAAFPLWSEIVGPEIAAVAKPEKIIRGRILVVRVADAAWAQELAMRKPELLDRIFERKLGAPIEDIQFMSGAPKNFK